MDKKPIHKIDLKNMPFEQGGSLLVKHALEKVAVGESVQLNGQSEGLSIMARTWARSKGHSWQKKESTNDETLCGEITRGSISEMRWSNAEKTGGIDAYNESDVLESPPLHWGLAARGATVEKGLKGFNFNLNKKEEIWCDDISRLYTLAAEAQWDPNKVIPWDSKFTLPDEIEDALVQVMTFLIENETVALIVPARFLGQVHPHFREVMQLLAIQTADEARHIEVFTRRATLKRENLGLSTVDGQLSLKTLMDEPDFALASFLLSVLGEGTFLSLLWFLHKHAPDPITEKIMELSAQDEARHVAFGMAHLVRHSKIDKNLQKRLANAIHQRYDVLANTAGLNEEVFDALVLLAAGSWELESIQKGYKAVMELLNEMDELRQHRLVKLGFSIDDAESLSSLHTRNFM